MNDVRVFRNTWVFDEFEANRRPFPNAIILGDAIYPRLPWLIPMLPDAPDNQRRFYRYFLFLETKWNTFLEHIPEQDAELKIRLRSGKIDGEFLKKPSE